jgi:hypothetical protein
MGKKDSDKLISNITLECMMNKELYSKYLDNNLEIKKKYKEKDKKFYKKRIIEITKRLLNNDSLEIENPGLVFSFDNFIASCIQYFKIIDKTDIIQQEYNDLDLIVENPTVIPDENKDILIVDNKYIMYNLEKENTLDNFVIKVKKEEKPKIFPKKRDINLRDPKLKNKGIQKKENITTIYDTETKCNLVEEQKTE